MRTDRKRGCFCVSGQVGIRPAFYYADDEIIVVASERPVIQTILDVKTDQVRELMAGESLIVKKDGKMTLELIERADQITPCSFERIYFSRGSDRDIYRERKMLGYLLTTRFCRRWITIRTIPFFLIFPIRRKLLIMGCWKAWKIIWTPKKCRVTGDK